MTTPQTTDIVDRLLDLHKQATTERSHYYVASCVQSAVTEIMQLRNFVQFVANCSNDPGVRSEAIKMGAKP
jgi:hypothetical protein